MWNTHDISLGICDTWLTSNMKKNLVYNLDCYISRNIETTSVLWAVSPGVLVVDGAPLLVRLSLLLTSLFPLRAYLHSSCQVYRVDQKGQSLRQVSQDVIWRMIVIDFKLLGTLNHLNQVKEAKWHYFFSTFRYRRAFFAWNYFNIERSKGGLMAVAILT